MSEYPPQVACLLDAIRTLPGVFEAEAGVVDFEQIDEKLVTMAGDYADFPQVAVYRTDGGRRNEVLVSIFLRFRSNRDGWIAQEFLAWWVRDLARSGRTIQMRCLALPPIAFDTQLGRTFRCVVEYFLINTDDSIEPVLVEMQHLADSLRESIELYREPLANPAPPVEEADT